MPRTFAARRYSSSSRVVNFYIPRVRVYRTAAVTFQEMASDTIISLPAEIIVYILEGRQLGFSDVINFSSTCKHLYKIVRNNNKLWERKFFQRWPLLKETYQTSHESRRKLHWREEIIASLGSRRALLSSLLFMSGTHYRKVELPNCEFKEFDPMFRPEQGAHPFAYYFLVDELISLINRPASASNLTHRYYALKIVRYLKQSHLKDEWQKFISLPPKQQILERGATIISQWSQPNKHVSYSHISSLLDNIADQVKELLRQQYPAHSIFSAWTDQFTYWRNNIIDDNQWSVTETRQITDVLCKVLFEKLGFYGNSEMYYSSENLFIDCVLERKQGIPITLAIIFESVARRLGVRCEPVSFPSHFLLRWKERYGPEFKDAENFYIDVFNGGQFLTKEHCPRIGGVSKCPIEKYNVHEPATTIEVVTRMANNLQIATRQHTHLNDRTARLRSALELQHMVEPNNMNTIVQLSRIYILQEMDLTELVITLETMEDLEVMSRRRANIISEACQAWKKHLLPDEEVEPKQREPPVKYAVGLIMKHKIHGHLCVITGWDVHRKESKVWMNEINVDHLEASTDQPFYYTCMDDGSSRYVAQENLSLAPNPEWINHHSTGRYFYAFNGTHYVPNVELAREYPEDGKVRDEWLLVYTQSGMVYDTT